MTPERWLILAGVGTWLAALLPVVLAAVGGHLIPIPWRPPNRAAVSQGERPRQGRPPPKKRGGRRDGSIGRGEGQLAQLSACGRTVQEAP